MQGEFIHEKKAHGAPANTGPPKNANKLAYTPSVTASSLIDVHLSGLNTSTSSPHTSGFLSRWRFTV
ncbi:hypothetical protein PISMIDRAFT_690941 [Pisolithus microcarpus 441]|uniref:Uncharacterized protein n=1 Tax=Pisolithus microcarpus 441 TaxID=765257 RepID=A0A0C9Y9B2_9AGAM|nr:hypothetical protein PISMIDRAFT_690941 [Pisolithus microcarpus 441]